jgi:hypothetical protein
MKGTVRQRTGWDKVAIITGASRSLGATPPSISLGQASISSLPITRIRKKLRLSSARLKRSEGRPAGFRLDTGDVRSFDGFVADVRKALQRWGRDRLIIL